MHSTQQAKGNKSINSMRITSLAKNFKIPKKASVEKFNLHFAPIDNKLFDRNHKHIHNGVKILRMDEYHWIYLRNIRGINVIIYHIHSPDEFPR
jgi:hypothetical protein